MKTALAFVFSIFWLSFTHARQLQIFSTGFGDQAAEIVAMASFYSLRLQIQPSQPTTVGVMLTHGLPTHLSAYMEHEENATLGVQSVMIKINASTAKGDLSTVLAHEMIHVSQYVRGDLYRISSAMFRWRGQLVFDTHAIPYRLRKWEKEAFAGEKELVKEWDAWKASHQMRPSAK